MVAVSVTAEDVAAGKRGHCFLCPVALALRRATGDGDANVYEHYLVLYLEVGCRSVPAPASVREFVWAFDDGEDPGPFTFRLPGPDDPGWRESCQGCQDLFVPSALDGEGCCPDCREEGG